MRKTSTILIALGVLVLAAGAALYIHNVVIDRAGSAESSSALSDILEQIPGTQEVTEEWLYNHAYLSDLDESGSSLPPATPEMPVVWSDGKAYIGTIEVPSVKITLPVQADWDEESAKQTPCKYHGSIYTGDLVIAGHNYRSHFGPLKYTKVGNTVKFTDANGYVYTYQITSIETVDQYDTDTMFSGDWDMTLYTCTYSGSARLAVRCALVI